MASRSHRHSRKKKKLNKGLKLSILRYGTVISAIVVVFILVLAVTGGFDDPVNETVMDNEYIPNDIIQKSLDSNEDTEAVINQEKSIIDVDQEEKIDLIESPDFDNDDDALINAEEIVDEESSNDEGTTNTSSVAENTDIEESIDDEVDLTMDDSSMNDQKVSTADDSDVTSQEDVEPVEDTNLEVIESNQEQDVVNDEEIIEEVEEEGNYVKDEWVDEIIQDNRTDINDQDLAVGAPIYNKLDTAYVFGLAEDGFTEEEKVELMIYLEEHLTAEEIAIAMELFEKYIGYLN